MPEEQFPPTEPGYMSAGRRHKAILGVDVFAAARARMDDIYRRFPTGEIVVSWSGGKDSTICLYLALEAAERAGRLPVKVMFIDEEVINPEIIELAYYHKADPRIDFYWCCIPGKYRNAASEVEPNFVPWDPDKRALWTHQPPPDAHWPAGKTVTDWENPPPIPIRAMKALFPPSAERPLINVTGLRAQESFVRYTALLSSGGYITKGDRHFYIARPAYDWTDKDVWLSFKMFGWVYNKAYEKMWRLGRSRQQARIAPLFHAEAVEQLTTVMRGWPNFWTLVKKRVRGAAAVAIYGGKLHAVERYGNETWYDAAIRYLNTLGNPAHRELMRGWVQSMLNEHDSHSNRPLQDATPCTECKLDWKLIARACARGDLHKRMLKTNRGLELKSPTKLPTHQAGQPKE